MIQDNLRKEYGQLARRRLCKDGLEINIRIFYAFQDFADSLESEAETRNNEEDSSVVEGNFIEEESGAAAAAAIKPDEFHEEEEAPEPGPSWSTSSYPSLESPGRLWDEIQHDALDAEFSLGLALEDDEVLAMEDVLAVSFFHQICYSHDETRL